MHTRTHHQATSDAADLEQPSSLRSSLLAIALAVGAFMAAPSVAGAQQQSGTADPGVRCAAKVGPGEYEFYMPGAKVTDVNGNKWVCGPDGQWFRDYSAMTATTGTTSPTYTTTTTRLQTYQLAPTKTATVSLR